MLEELKVFTGNAHPTLAQAICDYSNIPLGEAEVFEFSNENIFVRVLENVRHRDVFIVQPTCSPVSKSIMELLIMIDAMKRASAGRITAVIPYYAYGRTDKKDQPRVPITARLIADLITVAGAHRVLTVDLHAGQIQGFFDIPVDELTAFYTISHYIEEKALEDLVIVAADVGITKRARNLAERLNTPLAIVEKRRLGNTDHSEALHLIGDVRGLSALIFDDEVDTAGSIVADANLLQENGAREIYACCTHAILSGPAPKRIAESPIKELVVTDTVPLPPEKNIPKITTLTVAPLLGEAILRIHKGDSIGAMFEA